LDFANPSIASYIRTYAAQKLYVINNLSGNKQHIHLTFDDEHITGLRDLVSGEDYAILSQKSIDIQLEPYEYRWMITYQRKPDHTLLVILQEELWKLPNGLLFTQIAHLLGFCHP
jgi:hypothetical protein